MTYRPAKIAAAAAAPARGGARRAKPRRGNGVLEAALVLPILLSLSMGMVEFGQFFYMKHSVQAASRDAARTAILSSVTHTQASDAAKATMANAGVPFGTGTKYSIAFTNSSGGATIADVGTVAKGTSIKVTVSSTAGQISVRPLGVITAARPIVGITTMIKE